MSNTAVVRRAINPRIPPMRGRQVCAGLVSELFYRHYTVVFPPCSGIRLQFQKHTLHTCSYPKDLLERLFSSLVSFGSCLRRVGVSVISKGRAGYMFRKTVNTMNLAAIEISRTDFVSKKEENKQRREQRGTTPTGRSRRKFYRDNICTQQIYNNDRQKEGFVFLNRNFAENS